MSLWTLDSGTVTLDSGVFTWDGFGPDAGLGLAGAGIGLARNPAVDFVLMGPGVYGHVPTPKPPNVHDLWQRRVVRQDRGEMREMMALYAAWKQAA